MKKHHEIRVNTLKGNQFFPCYWRNLHSGPCKYMSLAAGSEDSMLLVQRLVTESEGPEKVLPTSHLHNPFPQIRTNFIILSPSWTSGHPFSPFPYQDSLYISCLPIRQTCMTFICDLYKSRSSFLCNYHKMSEDDHSSAPYAEITNIWSFTSTYL